MSRATGYDADSKPNIITKWYAGTDAIKRGYNFCYDTAADADASDIKLRMGNKIVKPATAHLNAYAGVAVNDCQGPCFVDLYEPERGQFVEALTDANMTKFTSLLGVQDGSYALAIKSDPATYADDAIDDLIRQAVCQAAETANTDTTNANARVMFV